MHMAMIEKVRISWSEVESLAEACAAMLEYKFCESKSFINIYAIPRGGLIPAVLISHKMKNLKSYIHSFDPTRHWSFLSNSVVIDDIYDTGKTLDPLMQVWSENPFCTLAHKKENAQMLFQGRYVPPEKWLVFPWERHHEIPNR